jgi:arginine/ornithine transport system substrate-binding protein
VDIANALCEQIKRKCVFVEQVWDSMIPGLQARKYDVIISSMSITEDRQKSLTSPTSTTTPPAASCAKKDVKFTGAASLKGKKIGVLKGSTQEKYAVGELKPAGVDVVPMKHRTRSTWTSRPGAWMARWPTTWKPPAAF